MKNLIVPDDVARGIREGRISLLVEPMEKQPPAWTYMLPKLTQCYHCGLAVYFEGYGSDDRLRWWPDDREPHTACPAHLAAPYAPGDVVGIKEACWIDRPFHAPGGLSTVYAADVTERPRNTNPPFDNWVRYSASRMPLTEVRTRLRILTVEARLVGSITYDEAAEAMPLIITADTEGSYYEVGDLVTDCPIEAFRADWARRHPDLPFERAWGFFTTFELKGH